MSTTRDIVHIDNGVAATDGAGVQLTRIIGHAELDMLDPFLMLDAFASDNPDDYIAGFPSHPHRGFETVTYLIAGRLRHKDNTGREGVIETGGVQWMTAGRGIVHSEMPEQENGLLMGFQLWVNLPASAKMTEPTYQEYRPDEIPVSRLENGTLVRVICGQSSDGTRGSVNNEYVHPLFIDVSLPQNETYEQPLTSDHAAFLYVIEGELSVNDKRINEKQLAVLGEGESVKVKSMAETTRFLLIAGEKLNESVARSGPFVMNTREELMQAYNDYSAGTF